MNDTITLKMSEFFGEFCADGSEAVQFIRSSAIPVILAGNTLELDFLHVRNMNSSFSNALFGNLAREFGESLLKQLAILNARDTLKKEIASALKLGFNSRPPQAA